MKTPLFFLAALFASLQLPALEIRQAEDRSVTVNAKTYRAAFGGDGRWKSLIIKDVEFFDAGGAFPSKEPPQQINLHDNLLAIRNDQVIVEYQFDETGIQIQTIGGSLSLELADNRTALVLDKQGVVTAERAGVGNVIRVISGEAAFEVNQVYHIVRGKMFPSHLTRGGNAEAKFSVRFECGISWDPSEMIDITSIVPKDITTKTVPSFDQGRVPTFDISLENLGLQESSVQMHYKVSNAFVQGTLSEETSLPAVTIPAGQQRTVTVAIPVTSPGIHWVNFELRNENRVLKRQQIAFLVDQARYRPALTRPDDFHAFWRQKLAALRAIPLNPVLREVPERSTAVATHYVVEIAGPDADPIQLELQVPKSAGPFPATFGGKMPKEADQADQIHVSLSHNGWPESATFNRWESARDNNHIDCYLLAVRITDYLRSREDVGEIFLFGASRQGPIQLVNAVLDPTHIRAVDAHVPTSMGISWTDYTYRGWGKNPSPPEMGAYVDPVNFAPDLRVPVMLDVGVFDGLSPAPGALAFYNHATAAPWKRISIEPGGHGYFTSGFREKTREELDTFTGKGSTPEIDERILQEH